MAIDLARLRHLREQALRPAAQTGKDNELCTPMDPARARRLRERHQAAQRTIAQAEQAGQDSQPCEPGDVLAAYRGKSKPDTRSYLVKWLLDRSPDVALGYAGFVVLLRVLTCATAPGADRYIGRRKLAKRVRVTVGTIRDHLRTLTRPWRLEDGPWQPPLFRREFEGWGPRRRTDWIALEAGWAGFVRTLDAHAKGQRVPEGKATR